MKIIQTTHIVMAIIILAAACSPTTTTPVSIDEMSSMAIQPTTVSKNSTQQVQDGPVYHQHSRLCLFPGKHYSEGGHTGDLDQPG